MAAASELFAEHGVGEVTTQQIADRADAAIDTLYPYASTKAELLIMVQNQRFAAAIDTGLAAAAVTARRGRWKASSRSSAKWWACVREQVENGRTYLHELVFGNPSSPTVARDSPSQPDSRTASRAC
jgi:AcrR family transcriptional regulator